MGAESFPAAGESPGRRSTTIADRYSGRRGTRRHIDPHSASIFQGIGGALKRGPSRASSRPKRASLLPGLLRPGDLALAVADEVPPHEDLRTERCATQQQHPRARVELRLQAVAAVAQVGQFVHREMLAAHFQPAFQRQQAVLEVRVERQLQGRGVVAGQVGTEQRRVEPARPVARPAHRPAG